MRERVVVGFCILAAACGTPAAPTAPTPGPPLPLAAGSPPPPAAPTVTAAAVQLGEAATRPGTMDADLGEVQPADPSKFNKVPGYSPYAGRNYPERPYFGDQHVHTAWSVDAGGTGTTLSPEEATRFARGEEVVSTTGQPVKLGSRWTGWR